MGGWWVQQRMPTVQPRYLRHWLRSLASLTVFSRRLSSPVWARGAALPLVLVLLPGTPVLKLPGPEVLLTGPAALPPPPPPMLLLPLPSYPVGCMYLFCSLPSSSSSSPSAAWQAAARAAMEA